MGRPPTTRRLAALLLGIALAPLAARAQPGSAPPAVNNWSELRAALAGCWTPPPGTQGSLIAYRFGLDKTGKIRGTPLVTARRLAGDQQTRQRYEDAAEAALSRCFPLRVTPSFGAILGESPIRLRFVNTAPTAAYQINSNITIFAPQ